jgi:serine/threonine protein kinase/Tfp pilus assembly protein PilF
MNNPVDQNAPAVTVPDHELIGRIGGGSYGEVWLARSALGAFRAVKVINRKSFEDDRPFEREFGGIQRFEPISRSHEGLVDILQVGRQKDCFYYVMELADDAQRNPEKDGSNLADKGANKTVPARVATSSIEFETYIPCTLRYNLNETGRLPVSQCIEIGLALTSALAHMHRHGLVHRDIKPSNIIFVAGAPKLADIGLVTEADTTLSYVGTEGYIPPEGPGATPADIFSLGKVLYEMATGQDRRQFPDLPPTLNEWPERAALLEVNAVLLKCCDRDLRIRYQNCDELHADLLRLHRGQSVKRHHLWQKRWSFLRSYGVAAAAVGLLILTGLAINKSRRGHVPDPEALRLYDEGQFSYNQLTPQAHAKALEYLTQATEKDPKFPNPYGELLALYTWNLLPGITNDQIRLQKVREIADKALAANPNAAQGHMALSWWHFLQRDWRGAEAKIQEAIQLDPDLALAHDFYGFYLSMQGKVKEAREQGELSAKQPSVSKRAAAIIASWPYITERRLDLAIAQLKQVLELDPNFAWGHRYLGDCYEASSNYVAAIEEFRKADLLSDKHPAKVAAYYDALLRAWNDSGWKGYLRKRIDLALAERNLPPNEKMQAVVSDWNTAGYYARLGEKENALKELEDRIDEPQVWHQLKFLPMYDPLHDDPRFQALLKRAGFEP